MTRMTPQQGVELQFEAYNRRDLALFLAAFAEDVRSFRRPDMTPLVAGKGLWPVLRPRRAAGAAGQLDGDRQQGHRHELIHGLNEQPMETAIMFVVEEGPITTVFSIPAKTPL